MITPLWTSLGGKLAERWAGLLLSPALGFWGGGLLTWVYAHGGFSGKNSGWKELERNWHKSFDDPPILAQVILIMLALLVVAASARLVEAFNLIALRIMEGYWPKPLRPLRLAMISFRRRVYNKRMRRLIALDEKIGKGGITAHERAEYDALWERNALIPQSQEDRMPTRLGDILRTFELAPAHYYGLGTSICWPRLWILLPEQDREEVGAARARLDESARLWTWGILFLVWIQFTWWAVPIALIEAICGNALACSHAATYGQLLQAYFDTRRPLLYESLGVTFPRNDYRSEFEAGKELTENLEAGPPLTEKTISADQDAITEQAGCAGILLFSAAWAMLLARRLFKEHNEMK